MANKNGNIRLVLVLVVLSTLMCTCEGRRGGSSRGGRFGRTRTRVSYRIGTGNDHYHHRRGTSNGEIGGIVFGVIFGVVAIIIAVCFCCIVGPGCKHSDFCRGKYSSPANAFRYTDSPRNNHTTTSDNDHTTTPEDKTSPDKTTEPSPPSYESVVNDNKRDYPDPGFKSDLPYPSKPDSSYPSFSSTTSAGLPYPAKPTDEAGYLSPSAPPQFVSANHGDDAGYSTPSAPAEYSKSDLSSNPDSSYPGFSGTTSGGLPYPAKPTDEAGFLGPSASAQHDSAYHSDGAGYSTPSAPTQHSSAAGSGPPGHSAPIGFEGQNM